MSGVDEALVEKAAQTFLATPGDYPGQEEEWRWAKHHARAILDAVVPDIHREVAEEHDATVEELRHRIAQVDRIRALCAGPGVHPKAPLYVRIDAVLAILDEQAADEAAPPVAVERDVIAEALFRWEYRGTYLENQRWEHIDSTRRFRFQQYADVVLLVQGRRHCPRGR